MCGIAGFFEPRPQHHAALPAMLAAMIPRGPDDGGHAEVRLRDAGRLLLGARRLAILDLSSAGHQPMRDSVTGNWLVYNGEIYNFRELRRELQQRGCQFRSETDTEVLLHGYRVWGESVLPRLEGMFAFALWDAQRQELLLARDRHGIKPLYYFERGEIFAFASEVRALLASGLVPRELDATGLDSLLKFGAVQEPATLLRGVRMLPAGCALRRRGSETARVASYWNIFQHSVCAKGRSRHREGFAVELRDALRSAVKSRLVSDVPLGIFLSGGLDSSVVAALAASSGARLRTFSVTFEEAQFAEGQKARRVAQHLGAEHREILLSQRELLDGLPGALAAMDQPSVDGINTYFVSRAAKLGGVTVGLSGLGGDELFAGYRSFRQAPRMELCRRALPQWIARLAGRAVGAVPSDRNAKLAAWLGGRDALAHPVFVSRLLLTPERVARLLRPEWLAQVDFSVYRQQTSDVAEMLASTDPVNRVSCLELATYLRNTLLRDSDCMSMANSLELRMPLLDHALTALVMAAPGKWKLQAGRRKPLLAAAACDLLPAEILNQPKQGFEFPWSRWMRGELRDEVREALAEPGDLLADVLDWRGVTELWNGFAAGRVHWSRPWLFCVLKKWVARNLIESQVAQAEPARIESAA